MTHHDDIPADMDLADYWDSRYEGEGRIWTGKVNQVLAEIASDMTPGRSLDLGCGEGGDVIWLARNGWTALGIDISKNAIARAKQAAQAEGLDDSRAQFIAGDLTQMEIDGSFDLVSASFFQSPLLFDRSAYFQTAASMVSVGGQILVVSHATMPARTDGGGPSLFTPEEEVETLGLSRDEWEPLIVERRPRTHQHDGVELDLDDSVVLFRRLR